MRSLLQTFINERRLPSGGSMEIKVLDIVKLGYGECNLHVGGALCEWWWRWLFLFIEPLNWILNKMS